MSHRHHRYRTHLTVSGSFIERRLLPALLSVCLLQLFTGCHRKMNNENQTREQAALRYNAQETDAALNLDAIINGQGATAAGPKGSVLPPLDPDEQASIDHMADDVARLEAFKNRQRKGQPGLQGIIGDPAAHLAQSGDAPSGSDEGGTQASALPPPIGPKVIWSQSDPDYTRIHAGESTHGGVRGSSTAASMVESNDKATDQKQTAVDVSADQIEDHIKDDTQEAHAPRSDTRDAAAAVQTDVSHALVPTTDTAVVALNAQLHRDVADSKSPLQQYLAMASLAMLDGKQQVDPDALYDLTDGEKKLLAEYQSAQIALGRRFAAGSTGKDSVIHSIDDLAARLSADQLLTIADCRLCLSVQNFGMYDEIPSTAFIPGEPVRMIVYAEIEHFNSVPSTEGMFVTRLHHEVELYTEKDGQCVYKWGSVPVVDYCRKVRRDFFIPRQIALPTNLTMGKYRLKVRITDDATQAQAESVIPISVVAAAGNLEAHK